MSEKSTRDLIDRYHGYTTDHNSVKFRAIVDLLLAHMETNQIAPDEIRDAAFVASIAFLGRHPTDVIYRRDDLDDMFLKNPAGKA